MIPKREGTSFLKSLEHGEHCVSITEFQGQILILTNRRLFRLVDEKLEEVQVSYENPHS